MGSQSLVDDSYVGDGFRRRHGFQATYAAGCRCGACREAQRVWMLGYRRRRGVLPIEQVNAERRAAAEARDNHGTETRYTRGCRCDDCRRAGTEARRRRRATKAAA